MPSMFSKISRDCNGCFYYPWRQNEWLARHRVNRQIGNLFRMDRGICFFLAAEYLAMERSGLADMFQLHMSHPNSYETMQWLQEKKFYGANADDEVREYLSVYGRNSVGTYTMTTPQVTDLAREVAKGTGATIVGFSKWRLGHAIAVVNGPIFRVFDPNFGYTGFVRRSDLITFLTRFLVAEPGYGEFLNGTRIRYQGTVWRFT